MGNPLNNRGAAKAANALNNTGFLHQMMRAFAVNTLGRQFYEMNAETEEIDLQEFHRLTLDQVGVPHSLKSESVAAVLETATGDLPVGDAKVESEDFARFALYALFNGEAIKRQINWAEIWREVFNLDR